MSKKQSNLNENTSASVGNKNSGDVLRTMQLEDLDLGKSGKARSDELLDDVEGLLKEDNELDAQATGNPMEHVDAISRRIEELSAALKQPLSACDCNETADRMIEIDARLAKLQNEVNKQVGRGDKLESGLELISVLGNKIESLTDVVKLSVMEDEVKEDYTEHFQELATQVTAVKQLLGDMPDNSEAFSRQAESIQALDLRVAEVLEQTKKTPSQLEELASKLDSMGVLLENTDPLKGLDKKLKSMAESLSQNDKLEALEKQLGSVADQVKQTDQLDSLSGKVEAIASLVQNNEKLADMETQLESIASLVGNNEKLVSVQNQLETIVGLVGDNDKWAGLDSKLESLTSSVQDLEQLNQLGQKVDSLTSAVDQSEAFSALNEQLGTLKQSLSQNEQIVELTAKFEKLHDFVKLGALENEQFDAVRFNAMGDQITAIGQMLVEGNGGGSKGGGSNEHIEALNAKVESLVELVQQNAASSADADTGAVALLIQRFEGLQEFVSTSIAAGGSSDGASLEHIQQLAGKVDSLASLVESSGLQSGGDGGSSEHIQLLATKFESLASLVESSSSQGAVDNGSSERIDALAQKLDSLATLMESRNESPVSYDGEMPDYSNQIQALSDKIGETQSTVNTLVSSLVPLVESLQNGSVAPAPSAEEGAGDWEQQKKAMLEGYGMPADGDAADGQAPASAGAEPNNEEIEALRAELEEKLRRAEIDISIERAKIHQERRDLEEMQNDIDRKQQKINTHGSSSNTGTEEGEEDGESPGRWSRFLGN